VQASGGVVSRQSGGGRNSFLAADSDTSQGVKNSEVGVGLKRWSQRFTVVA
jgi:hypothetical protein